MDTQTVPSTNVSNPCTVGFDGNKCKKGVKRTIITDEYGFITDVNHFPANRNDSWIGNQMLKEFVVPNKYDYNEINELYIDNIFGGECFDTCKRLGITPVQHKNQKDAYLLAGYFHNKSVNNTFSLHPKRWVVERQHANIGHCRRLKVHYERSVESANSFCMLAQIRLLLNNL
jgi:hypothetical protein